jgi:hypothetical protein
MTRSTWLALPALALALTVAGCRDDNPAPAEPQSAVTAQAATPAQEPIRRPEQAIDPLERAQGVEQEVMDAKAKQDAEIEAGGG